MIGPNSAIAFRAIRMLFNFNDWVYNFWLAFITETSVVRIAIPRPFMAKEASPQFPSLLRQIKNIGFEGYFAVEGISQALGAEA